MANLQQLKNEYRMLSRESDDDGFKAHCALVRVAIQWLQTATTDAERAALEKLTTNRMKAARDYLAAKGGGG